MIRSDKHAYDVKEFKLGEDAMPYVSITGLRVRSWYNWPVFVWHAVKSMRQARMAPDCMRAEAKSIGGVQHTLSVWTSQSAMRAFMMSGAHREAMRAFRSIATGSTIGYETDAIPDWKTARQVWIERAKPY